jgi:hypothetical protein
MINIFYRVTWKSDLLVNVNFFSFLNVILQQYADMNEVVADATLLCLQTQIRKSSFFLYFRKKNNYQILNRNILYV